MSETKHYEVKDYETHGVKVCVAIDYDNEHISLVEQEKNSIPIRYKAKQWVFSNREIGYMQGWQHIFQAMSYAVEQAHKELKKHIDAKEKAKRKMQVRVIKAVAKEKGL